MTYQKILLSKLRINAANDRHGELYDVSSAIAWLFNNKENHMRALAADITSKGEVFEPPLVIKRNDFYEIYDGNRRVTCLKLIDDPQLAPTIDLQHFFENLKKLWGDKLLVEVFCQIETDLDRVDDILFRRHTGTQSGVGQATWDDRMKMNFTERTGKSRDRTIADSIEDFLKSHKKLPSQRDIPRSTLNRLLSSEVFRNRVGISFKKSEFILTHDESVVATGLQRVAHDLASRKIVLGDLWDSKKKLKYLDQLDQEGVLPNDSHKLELTNFKKPPSKLKSGSKNIRRKKLIPNVNYEIVWSKEMLRHQSVWEELQFQLSFGPHTNAISVLFRVLIELSAMHYISKTNLVSVHDNDTLSKKISKISTDLCSKGKITKEYRRDIKKLEQAENLISVNTLNRYIHAFELSPSPEHLKAIWGSLSPLIILCLKAER